MPSLILDGFSILGEGFGLSPARARRFADVLWLTTASLGGGWMGAVLAIWIAA
jgi:hypothetical protein